jgi:hypothetical protein
VPTSVLGLGRKRVAEAPVVDCRELGRIDDNHSLGCVLEVQTEDERELKEVSQNDKKSNLKHGNNFRKFLHFG